MNTNLIFWLVPIAGLVGGFFLKGEVGAGANWLVTLCALLVLVFAGAVACVLSERTKYSKLAPVSMIFVTGALTALLGFCMGAA